MLVLLTSACGVARRTPPPTPPKMPIADSEPDHVEPNAARLLVETTDGPAVVSAVTNESVVVTSYGAITGRTGKSLCITPCALDLQPGMITLEFSRRDRPTHYATTDVPLKKGRNSVRQALGRKQPASIGRLTGGLSLLSIGVAALATGLAVWAIDDDFLASKDVGIGLTVGGAAATLGGALLWWSGRPVMQEGAATQWWEPYPDGGRRSSSTTSASR